MLALARARGYCLFGAARFGSCVGGSAFLLELEGERERHDVYSVKQGGLCA